VPVRQARQHHTAVRRHHHSQGAGLLVLTPCTECRSCILGMQRN
jgi:hypothetical protein